MPARRQSRGKRFCFTLNNYTEENEIYLASLVENDADVVYVAYGREVGEHGTRHLQGMIIFGRRLRFRQVHEKLPGAHVEAMRGSLEQAKVYCEKDGDFVEFGSFPESRQGMRSDLDALKSDLDRGLPLREIGDSHFATFLKYQRGILAYRNVVAPKRDWLCSVVVYWGRTGAGKTRAVYDNLSSPDQLYVHAGGMWFDGYDGQSIVLFDDYGGSEFKISYLLKLLDRYPMQVPIKGGFVSWIPKEIYITSNRDPEQWYSNAHAEHVNAMFRRFTNKVQFY